MKIAYENFGGSGSCGHGWGASRAVSVVVESRIRTWMRASGGWNPDERSISAYRIVATVTCIRRNCDGRRTISTFSNKYLADAKVHQELTTTLWRCGGCASIQLRN